MNKLLRITLLEWKLNNRNFLNIFFALIFPVMMLLLFGTMYGNESNAVMGGFGGVDASVPGYLGMIIAVSGLMSLPITLAQYRERKILKRFMASPLKPIEILISQLIVNTMTTLVGVAILLLAGKLVFDLHVFGNIFSVFLGFIMTLMAIFALGLFIAGVSPNTKAATAISYIVYFPMLFLSGATFPLEFMPASILTLSKIFPLTYGIKMLKGIWLGGSIGAYGLEIAILLITFVICSTLSIKLFRWE